MRHTEQLLPTAIGELNCLRPNSDVTIDELNALAVSAECIDNLLSSCVEQLRPDHSWEEIGAAVGCSANAARLRFATPDSALSVGQFWDEVSPLIRSDFLPSSLIHHAYVEWHGRAAKDREALPPKAFVRRLRALTKKSGTWEYTRARITSLDFSGEHLVSQAPGWSPTGEGAQYGFRRVPVDTGAGTA